MGVRLSPCPLERVVAGHLIRYRKYFRRARVPAYDAYLLGSAYVVRGNQLDNAPVGHVALGRLADRNFKMPRRLLLRGFFFRAGDNPYFNVHKETFLPRAAE